MCDYEVLSGRARILFPQLAKAIALPEGVLRFTVSGGWLVKIEAIARFSACRPAKKYAIWDRVTSMTGAQFDRIEEQVAGELETLIPGLTGKYGAVEVEFAEGKMISLMIKMALRRVRRHAVGR